MAEALACDKADERDNLSPPTLSMPMPHHFAPFPMLLAVAMMAACEPHAQPADEADAGVPDAGPIDTGGPKAGFFCDLPGSARYTNAGTTVVPGGTGTSNLAFMKLPPGFCAHYFGKVGNARQMRFAPGGELFVASPTSITTGGGGGALAAIVILPDDNKDGFADSVMTFMDRMPSTQGILFTQQHFYYQNSTRILRIPYQAGDRLPRLPGEEVANITVYNSPLHWPKPLDQADDGTIYVGNGGDQGEVCDPAHPFHGGILKLDGTPEGTQVAKGFRNPIAVRCQRGYNQCFAVELAKDYSAAEGGREKLVLIRQGDDWGFPCCAYKDIPFDTRMATDCSRVMPEDVSFLIGDTPFSFDFEPGKWPPPYTKSIFVPLHGTAGPWLGARLVAVAVDPATGLPRPGTTIDGGVSMGAMSDFATGWDDGTLMHGRPAAVTFAPDGRLFLANDNNGDIFWIAPFGLEM